MVFGDSLTKAGRLVELQRTFWRNPGRVLSTEELADRIDVAPRTVRKYLKELSSSGSLPIYREGRGWKLAEDARMEILPVRFQLEEAVAVYLAARLLLRHAGESSPAIQSAVSKMSTVVPADLRTACARLTDRVDAKNDPTAAAIFRTLVYGWVLHRLVSVVYESRTRGTPHMLDFRPYLIEPSAVGSSVYVVGRADPPGDLRVMKLARIKSARLLHATFDPPPAGRHPRPPRQRLGDLDDRKRPGRCPPALHGTVAGRVQETRWHPSQQLTTNDDGSLDMRLAIASTIEIINWVLSWGPHCEVLQPQDLRDRIAGDLRAAARVYR